MRNQKNLEDFVKIIRRKKELIMKVILIILATFILFCFWCVGVEANETQKIETRQVSIYYKDGKFYLYDIKPKLVVDEASTKLGISLTDQEKLIRGEKPILVSSKETRYIFWKKWIPIEEITIFPKKIFLSENIFRDEDLKSQKIYKLRVLWLILPFFLIIFALNMGNIASKIKGKSFLFGVILFPIILYLPLILKGNKNPEGLLSATVSTVIFIFTVIYFRIHSKGVDADSWRWIFIIILFLILFFVITIVSINYSLNILYFSSIYFVSFFTSFFFFRKKEKQKMNEINEADEKEKKLLASGANR